MTLNFHEADIEMDGVLEGEGAEGAEGIGNDGFVFLKFELLL